MNRVRLTAVGDIALSDHPLLYGHGVKSQLNRGENIFESVRDILRDSDITLGNLECPLSNVNMGDNLTEKTFRGEPRFCEILKDAGFSILTIANNHMMHHGEEVFKDTIEHLLNNHIKPIGGSLDTNYTYYIQEIDGIRLCVIGYSIIKERHSTKPLYFYDNTEALIKLVEEVNQKVDYIILSIHWGEEDLDRPTKEIIDLSRMLCDRGVSVILGHHPHVLQAIEKYRGSIIFFSLGNFVFDCIWDKKYRNSVIAKLIFTKKSIDYELIPINISKSYRPEPVVGRRKKSIIDYISKISVVEYYNPFLANKDDIEEVRLKEIRRKEDFKLAIKKMFFLLLHIHKMRKETFMYLLSKVYR